MIKAISWLDFKLGLRILIKYPWLTLVGGLGMAVAVAIGASFFGIIYSLMDSTLPLDEGDRVVSIQNWDDAADDRPDRHIVYDYFVWRNELTTVQDVGVFRTLPRNLVAPHGEPEVVPAAEMTASGFRVARVPALMGRHLADADERKDAPPVAVIGYDIWKTRFASDPDILKRNVQIGATTYSVVGVMPEGFAFPLKNNVWIPLRAGPTDYQPRKGPIAYGFGRLTPGVSLDEAQAEITSIGKRMSAAMPETHAKLRPSVLPYTYPFFDIDDVQTVWAYHLLQMCITLLLVLVCANVATLVYARTATRAGEIAVRSALGASRQRIVGQLFTEALVLAAFASVVGITIAKWALRQCHIFLDTAMGGLPFWMDIDVSLGVMLYIIGVTVLAAMIVGAMPAVKATGRRVQAQLRELGGGSGLRLGRTWTVLIVAQVAFAVAILPATIYYAWDYARYSFVGPGFPAEQFLTATLGMDRITAPELDAETFNRQHALRYATRQAELLPQLRAEPGVAAATFSLDNPGEEPTAMIEIEGQPLPKDSVNYSLGDGTRKGYGVRTNRIDIDFFKAFDVAVVRGRAFGLADRDSGSSAVIVNNAFVQQYLGNGKAVGRRVRFVGRGGDTDPAHVPLGRWYEIVGVVEDFPPNNMAPDENTARLYHPPVRGEIYSTLFLRTRGTAPAAFTPRLRQITMAVDPNLQLRNVSSLDEVLRLEQRMMRLGAVALVAMTISVLLLSAAGIYSLMSLSVSQRRREIGIRVALGAHPRRILRAIFSRAARQLVIGIVVGVAASFFPDKLMWGELMRGQAAILLPTVATVMMIVGLLAATGPARRGLQIQPTEALRDL